MEEIHELDMDKASDFLQMAATLVHIKSRALLPVKRQGRGAGRGWPDRGTTADSKPQRSTKKYKEAMEQLKTMEDENKVFSCIGGTFI